MSQSVFPNSDFFEKIMFGMRVIHLIFLLYLSTSVVAYSATEAESKSNYPVFDCAIGEQGKRAFLRLPKGDREVKAILYCHQNMTEEVLFRSKLFTDRMDSLGVAMAFVQQGSQNWDTASGCQERFDSIISDFASATGHQEISTAPIIPFGHSAQATFPWNFAAWNPQRTLCIISYHGDAPRTNLCGYGRANIEWGRTRNIDSIPGLMIEGEYEWWEGGTRASGAGIPHDVSRKPHLFPLRCRARPFRSRRGYTALHCALHREIPRRSTPGRRRALFALACRRKRVYRSARLLLVSRQRNGRMDAPTL